MNQLLYQSSAAETAQILRLVELAREVGEQDHYSGKRDWVRYNAAIPLEVALDPDHGSNISAATMHNVSGGGVAFWARRELPMHTIVFLRDWTDGAPNSWISARVRHVTIGIKGFLIGTEFLSPAPRDS